MPTDGVVLEARLRTPARPHAVVVLARETSPQGTSADALDVLSRGFVSRLGARGFALLAVELLVAGECDDVRRRLDVFLLARRLEATTTLAREMPMIGTPRVAYLAEGPCAAGALVASLGDPRVAAIVSRRGRPDLAEGILHRVTAPTLLMTDQETFGVNASARRLFRCPTGLTLADPLARSTRKHGADDDDVLAWLWRHVADGGAAERRRPPRARSSSAPWTQPVAKAAGL